MACYVMLLVCPIWYDNQCDRVCYVMLLVCPIWYDNQCDIDVYLAGTSFGSSTVMATIVTNRHAGTIWCSIHNTTAHNCDSNKDMPACVHNYVNLFIFSVANYCFSRQHFSL